MSQQHFFNSPNLEQLEKSDRRKSNIVTFLALLLISFVLLFPFFSTIFPIPEAEGLQVAFGDVEMAGGDNPNTSNPNTNIAPTPSPPTPTPPEKTDITTIDDKDPDITNPDDNKNVKPTPNPTPNPNTNPNAGGTPTPSVDPNSMFGGFGNNTGAGKQGDPSGKKDLGGTGRGDQGNGDGKVGNRAILEKCTSTMGNTDWDEVGTAWVFICVDENGKVLEATYQSKTSKGDISSVTSANQRKIAERCAKEYKYQAAPNMGTACGSIPVTFKKQ